MFSQCILNDRSIHTMMGSYVKVQSYQVSPYPAPLMLLWRKATQIKQYQKLFTILASSKTRLIIVYSKYWVFEVCFTCGSSIQTHGRCDLGLNTPLVGIGEHAQPWRRHHVRPIRRRPRPLPWQHAPLGVRHHGKMAAIGRAQGRHATWRAVRVQRVRFGRDASVVDVLEWGETLWHHFLLQSGVLKLQPSCEGREKLIK